MKKEFDITEKDVCIAELKKEFKLSDEDEQDELQAISQDEENKIWEEEQIRKEFKGEIK